MATTICKGQYEVISGEERYIVDIENKTCSCRGWYYTKNCKHLGLFSIKNSLEQTKMQFTKHEIAEMLTACRSYSNILAYNNKGQGDDLFRLRLLIEKLETTLEVQRIE